jgi:SAM-dependent methyltransferase
MDRAAYDRMAEIDGTHWWFAARRQIITDLIRRRVAPPKSARILEVGCGTGSNIAMLQQFGAVDALEPDDGAREWAMQRSGLAIQGGFLPEDGDRIAGAAYDMIVLLDVLEHIPQDGPALATLREKLAPGGRILLTVPAMRWLWSAHDAVHHHQRRYTRAGLRKVVEDAGFRISYISYFNTLLFPLVVAARAVGKLTGREGGDDAMPGGLVNRVLKGLFASERHWLVRGAFPVGVSLACVAEPIR